MYILTLITGQTITATPAELDALGSLNDFLVTSIVYCSEIAE
jgi:hypothetical protein